MGMQKYRADESTPQSGGAMLWHAKWLGGPSLARINNCRLVTLSGDPRATVFVTGEPDTMFSQPAVCSYKGARVGGYITSEDGDLVFRHTTYAQKGSV